MKTYKEFITEVLKPDEKTRETLAAKRMEREEERKQKEEKEEKNELIKTAFEFLKKQNDQRSKDLLKLFQNGKIPTERQLESIIQIMHNKRRFLASKLLTKWGSDAYRRPRIEKIERDQDELKKRLDKAWEELFKMDHE